MRAFIVPEFGDPGSVGDRPTPTAETGQLLVRVHAAGVNAMDPVFRGGSYKDYMEHRLPLTPGIDYAGTVEAVGPDVDGFAVGDEVFGEVGKAYAGEGSFAEYVTVAAPLAAKRPAGVSAEQAAALPRAGGTALAAIDALETSPGDTIAIIGAGGGVGSFVTQLAADRGLRVIAVTHAGAADYVRGLGAADVVDRSNDELADALRALAPDGLDGLVDLFHDAAALAPLASLVRPGGRVVSPIAMGIDQALADSPVSGHMVGAAADRVSELADLAAAGRLTVPVEVLPLEQAADALDRLASKQVRGKLVLQVD
jgi:NADPH:quinone reductase-like Zn-dependent oxidoreductase